MTISDIITVISLVIAIVAIISEKNRKHLLLKFSYWDFILYGFAFLLINYFVFYEQFYLKGYILDFLYFENFGFNNPTNYSYLISIIVLITIFFKILYSFYPNRRKNQVLKYYKNLIENNEVSMLLELIEKYHTKDITKKIESNKSYHPDEKEWLSEKFRNHPLKNKVLYRLKICWQEANPYSKLNKNSYADSVLWMIINDPAFISLASNMRPYFFPNIFSTFKKEKIGAFPKDLINQYLTELIRVKSFWLIKELKQSDDFDTGLPEHLFENNKIISSLIQNVSVADANKIWRPFGEEAIKEIENEKFIVERSKLYQQYRNDDILWEYKVFIAVKFFNILIIESIVQKYSGSHFFLHYYWYITEKILDNFITTPPNDFEEVKSLNHYLIEIMNDNIFHWLNLANEYEIDRFHDIILCLGNQVNSITKSPYFGEKRKLDLVKSILGCYCNMEEKAKTSMLRSKLEEILIKPSMLTEETDPYYDYFGQAWKKFDKIPHHGYSDNIDNGYFVRLKEKVIDPLGFDPDER